MIAAASFADLLAYAGFAWAAAAFLAGAMVAAAFMVEGWRSVRARRAAGRRPLAPIVQLDLSRQRRAEVRRRRDGRDRWRA